MITVMIQTESGTVVCGNTYADDAELGMQCVVHLHDENGNMITRYGSVVEVFGRQNW